MENGSEIKKETIISAAAPNKEGGKKKCCHHGKAGLIVACIMLSVIFGSVSGFLSFKAAKDYYGQGIYTGVKNNLSQSVPDEKIKVVKEESAIIDAVKKVNPAVVSIIITQDLPKIEQYYSNPNSNDFFNIPFGLTPQSQGGGTQKQETGKGSGFVVSSDGYIVTNKHVVNDQNAEYTVLMNDGNKYSAKVVALDPSNDIAVIKIDAKNIPTVEFGDSSAIEVGQVAIAIGNALGEYKNTVSVGVVSGLGRSIVAGGQISQGEERLNNLIQTDAAINPGNSGGPLLNSSGQVIGMNTAIAGDAQGIGFSILGNDIKKVVNDVMTQGRIIRPYIGIRYMQLTKDIAAKNGISYVYGALIIRGDNPGDLAVIPSSPGDKAGLVENDIILEVDGVKLDESHSLADIVASHKVGDELTLKISHKGAESIVKLKLEERKQ